MAFTEQHTAPGVRKVFQRGQSVIVAFMVFLGLFAFSNWINPYPISYFDISFLASGGATTAIAAMGQTLVILSGGFDLSAGAVVSLVNAVLATYMDPLDANASVLLWTFIGIGVGMLVGAFNGIFIAFMRLQPIVVTLATMFIIQGGTLLVMDKPGGFVSPNLGLYMGDAIAGTLPFSIVLIGIVLLLWAILKRTRYGIALYSVGSDPDAAAASGIPVKLVLFATYTLAGGLYGLAGVFVSAQTGSGDPLVGNSLLLPIFAAVVIGGSRLGGGKGGLLGSVLGAYVLLIVVNILLSANVSAYYSTIAESAVLLFAVLAGSLTSDSTLNRQIQHLRISISASRKGLLARQRERVDRRLKFRGDPPQAPQAPSFLQRYGATLSHALPAWICLIVVVVITQFTLGNVFNGFGYWDSLLVLATFLAILALGQGAVILTGGLDLSVPWMIALSGVVLAGMVQGSNIGLVYAVPLVLGIAAFVGLLNGLGVVGLGLSPIVVTLAMNGFLQGATLLYSDGTPAGFAPSALRWLMTGELAGMTPIVPLMVLFAAIATVILGRTSFGRRIYAIGNSEEAAHLSGVRTGRTLIQVYVLCSMSAALVGILLTGFSGQASLGMGDEYLLPSIAIVVVGGALITGGRGHYLGMLGGALLLTAMQTLLAGSSLPYAFRAVFFGLVILVAVIGLRERKG